MSTTLQQPAFFLCRPTAARSLIVLSLVAGAAIGLTVGVHAGVETGDADLVRLLRAMAMLKLLFVAAASAAILWRLQRPIGAAGLGAYAVACAAMTAGPGLIWFLAHVGLAAILLHGGVAAALVLLWRDAAVGSLLQSMLARRRLGTAEANPPHRA